MRSYRAHNTAGAAHTGGCAGSPQPHLLCDSHHACAYVIGHRAHISSHTSWHRGTEPACAPWHSILLIVPTMCCTSAGLASRGAQSPAAAGSPRDTSARVHAQPTCTSHIIHTSCRRRQSASQARTAHTSTHLPTRGNAVRAIVFCAQIALVMHTLSHQLTLLHQMRPTMRRAAPHRSDSSARLPRPASSQSPTRARD